MYNVVIVGTGLVNSILAGALSRHNISVLIIDKNEYYGGVQIIKVPNEKLSIPETQTLLKSNGQMVDLLIRSGVGRYLEFKALDCMRVSQRKVPQTKEDIFSDPLITLLDKRKIMKFYNNVASFANDDDDCNVDRVKESFHDFLDANLPAKYAEMLLYAFIPRDHLSISKEAGLKELSDYVKSVGKFGGATGFLVNVYGMIPELCQAFCRYSAVYGGLFMLRSLPEKLCRMDNGNYCLSVANGEPLIAKYVIASTDYQYLIPSRDCTVRETTHHALMIYKRAEQDDGNFSYAVHPPIHPGDAPVIEQTFNLDESVGQSDGKAGAAYFYSNSKRLLDSTVECSGRHKLADVIHSSRINYTYSSLIKDNFALVPEYALTHEIEDACSLAHSLFLQIVDNLELEFYPKSYGNDED